MNKEYDEKVKRIMERQLTAPTFMHVNKNFKGLLVLVDEETHTTYAMTKENFIKFAEKA